MTINDYMRSKINNDKKVASKVDKNPVTAVSAIDSAFLIDEEYHEIIIALLYKPDRSKKKIFEEIRSKKKKDYDNSLETSINEKSKEYNRYGKIRRQVDELVNLKLVESLKEDKIGNFSDKTTSKLYRLSISGIFYVLINWHRISTQYSVLSALSKNYPDNLIFENFLYQYFEKQSIDEIGMYISSQIIAFLSNICKYIVNHLHMLTIPADYSMNGFPLFSWPSQSNEVKDEFSSQDELKLKNYLFKELSWKWILDARIIPNFMENKITIKSDEVDFTPVIKIFRKEKQAILNIGTTSIMFFGVVRESNGSLSINGKPIFSHTQFTYHSFNRWCREEVLLLIYRIYKINDFPDVDQSFVENIVGRTLIKDSTFKKTVESIRNTFKFKESVKA